MFAAQEEVLFMLTWFWDGDSATQQAELSQECARARQRLHNLVQLYVLT